MMRFVFCFFCTALFCVALHPAVLLAQPVGETELSLTGKWKLLVGESATPDKLLEVGYDDAKWADIEAPSYWDAKESPFPGFIGFGVYRKSVFIPASAKSKPLYLLLGKVSGVDETYFNGVPIGKTGSVKEEDNFTVRVYAIPDTLIAFGKKNVIAVRVFSKDAGGGIYEGGGTAKKTIGVYSKTPLRRLLGQPASLVTESVRKDVLAVIQGMDNALAMQDQSAYLSNLSETYFNNGTGFTEQKLFVQSIMRSLGGASMTYKDAQVYQLSPTRVAVDYDTEIRKSGALFYVAHDERFFVLEGKVWRESGNQSRLYTTEVKSKFIGEKVETLVYLPPSFLKEPTKKYPVLYLLHPQGGNPMVFKDVHLERMMDSLIEKKKMTEMIVVMPSEKNTSFVNANGRGAKLYEFFFLYELPDLLEPDIRASGERGVSGVSWGGNAAYFLSLASPRGRFMFNSVSGVMPKLNTAHIPDPRIDSGDTKFWKRFDLNAILDSVKADSLKKKEFLIITGKDDAFKSGNESAKVRFAQKLVPVTYSVYEGKHTFDFWSQHLAEALRFHAESFRKKKK
jgi:enterochelin esterase-like enzyme